MFCTYITIYRGDMMPSLYIGSSSLKKVESGYRGSVSSKEYKQIWLEEQTNNPHLFITKIISIHNSRKQAYEHEKYLHDLFDVINNTSFINKSKANGSGRFGGGFKGKQHTEEHRLYIKEKYIGRDTYWLKNKKRPDHSKIMTGAQNPMFGKKHNHKTKQIISSKNKGNKSRTGYKNSDVARQKIKESRSDGLYITPWGNFISSKDAVKCASSPYKDSSTVRLKCRNNNEGFKFIPKLVNTSSTK
jgi:hypothetical protein